MKYTILSINDERELLKDALFEGLWRHDYVPVKCYGPHEVIDNPPAQYWFSRPGETGVWYSQISAWRACVALNEPLLVLEDDALLLQPIDAWFASVGIDNPVDSQQYPIEPDALALRVPQDQYGDIMRDFTANGIAWPNVSPNHDLGNEYWSRAYQGYSCVALMYWPSGAQKLLDAVGRYGIHLPVDCFIFEQGWPIKAVYDNNTIHTGGVYQDRLNILAPKPDYATLFDVFDAPSLARR